MQGMKNDEPGWNLVHSTTIGRLNIFIALQNEFFVEEIQFGCIEPETSGTRRVAGSRANEHPLDLDELITVVKDQRLSLDVRL